MSPRSRSGRSRGCRSPRRSRRPRNPPSPGLPSPKFRSQLAPSVRGFKIAENQSPFPQDRVFFTFNYFNNVNANLDRYFDSPINNLSVYRYIFGFEKTFNDG